MTTLAVPLILVSQLLALVCPAGLCRAMVPSLLDGGQAQVRGTCCQTKGESSSDSSKPGQRSAQECCCQQHATPSVAKVEAMELEQALPPAWALPEEVGPPRPALIRWSSFSIPFDGPSRNVLYCIWRC